MKIVPVILCGGSGTRLWPLSRSGFPKQFLVLSGNQSLFQQTVARLMPLHSPTMPMDEWLVITHEEYRFLVLEQLREGHPVPATLLLEPSARNTAPALTLAALQATANGEDPILVVTPADQTVTRIDAFVTALRQAVAVAAADAIAILGIPPDRPETGYGYIRQSTTPGHQNLPMVASFVEKPDVATAQSFLESGDYFWNAGLFVLKASLWLRALQEFCPDILTAVTAAWSNRSSDAAFVRPDPKLFATIQAESIDYAVMERCPGSNFPIQMVPLDAGWNDLGGWDAVWQVGNRDEQGNAVMGDALLNATQDSLIVAQSRLVGTVGVKNLIIVETPDAVLVAARDQCQNVKKLVEHLVRQQREEYTCHRKVHRPWGWYDTIDAEGRFKVKRIQVKPGARLSLQKHHHRAEHWIVVKGTAEVTCGKKTFLLTENQSAYIPLGTVHRLANPGTIPLEIIEVQSGSYLGEDDIVRYADNYGRTAETT
ncbi:MAG: mannose-1-phosphate guanylyltransferase/mannose-6-phosphate isomerase [Magnetococcales bacterium]|nr:mannose-1-phosphate guanylyltransferase/mannose-6-phosphate isomerase [Magnetococcales bacterium]